MKDTIIDALNRRAITEISARSSIRYLRETSAAKYYNALIDTLYVFTRPRKGAEKSAIMFAEVVCGIGNRVRKSLGLPRDTAAAARTGAFLLWTFEDMGMLQVALTKGKRGHSQYAVQLLDDEPLSILWRALPDSAINRLPSSKPWAPWTATKDSHGERLIKTQNPFVLEYVTPENCPMIYKMINRAQQVGWQINRDMLPTIEWCLRDKADAFMDIWRAKNKDARTTKLREVKTIIDMAKRLKYTFFHRYYLDFRGRKYPATAYLHEQGTDLARSLLYREDREPITEAGFQWLQICLASNWAGDAGRLDKLKTDKIPIAERVKWADTNETVMLGYAADPIKNQGWMDADAPWMFLSGCLELKRFRDYQLSIGDMDDYSYMTGYEGYIDGSNNGCQHLAAMTKDEIVAPHVNLVPQPLPGDLYRYVGQHAWKLLEKQAEPYSKEDIIRCRWIINENKRMVEEFESTTDRDMRQALYAEHKDFRGTHKDLFKFATPIYWLRLTDQKDRRKLVKRNVMTIPYGGTAFGLGQQQIEDAPKHGIYALRFMARTWAVALGRIVYDDCRTSMARPMRLLGVFEAAGQMADAKGTFLQWRVPVTNFPIVQHYTEGVVKKIWVQYGPPAGDKLSNNYYQNTFQLALTFPEEQVPSKGKQATGASPNATHGCDAGHLTMTTDACDFVVTTIHDSFGALLPRMPALFREVREQFVRFYEADPLPKILNDMGGDISNVSFGTLDVRQIRDSEYAFL